LYYPGWDIVAGLSWTGHGGCTTLAKKLWLTYPEQDVVVVLPWP
jgi:hypothetical protein